MRVGKIAVLAALWPVATALFAQNSSYTPDNTWKAPAAAARKSNPVANSPNAVAQGKEIFDAQCAMCHGFDGRGLANAANFHEPAVQNQPDGALFWKITTGHQQKGMPSFQRLPEKQRWQLVSYLRTFKGK
jgi:mono/diheme cytochrome c family protein